MNIAIAPDSASADAGCAKSPRGRMQGAGRNTARIGAELAALLTAPAPVLATELGAQAKPLALGAGRILVARTPPGSRGKVRRLVCAYTRRTSYLRALAAPGSRRWTVDGEDAGEVSAEHRATAAAALAKRLEWKRRQKSNRRRSAQRAAERGAASLPAGTGR